MNLTRSTAERNEQKSTLSRLFWRLSGAQHNIKNFKDTIQNYTTYKEDENIPKGINDQLDVNFMMTKIIGIISQRLWSSWYIYAVWGKNKHIWNEWKKIDVLCGIRETIF